MSNETHDLIIVGDGEFGEIAYEYFTRDSPYNVVAFSAERAYMKQDSLFDLPVIPFEDLETLYDPVRYKVFVAITSTQLNRIRARLYREVKRKGYTLVSYISSRAFVWHNAQIGENCFIFENNVIQYHVRIGDNVVLWSGNHIGHRTVIGDHCFLASHVVISGYCTIGESCFLGVNCCIGDNLIVARDCVLGAGAVIVRNTDEQRVYVGNPARALDKSSFDTFKGAGERAMRWEKRGLVYVPDGSLWWAKQHAFPPTPYFISERVIRCYVAFCDENTVGRLGFVDLDAEDPSRVLDISQEPLNIGVPGAFDENGVVPTSIVKVGQELYLYYVGFQLGHKVRYYQFQGLAISRDGGESFRRYSQVPIIDRSDAELTNRTSAFVMHEDGLFKMWYVGGSEWLRVGDKPLPIYNMRYLESPDGKTWAKRKRSALISRTTTSMHWDERGSGKSAIYTMTYSIRTKSKGYRLGYAESMDGRSWVRKDDQIGIDVSAEGWDSNMIGYASIVDYKDRTYMFYNGNDRGATGFGYAVLVES